MRCQPCHSLATDHRHAGCAHPRRPEGESRQGLAHLRVHQNEWWDHYHLPRIGLFGSTARNEATASSDVDVWVELDPVTPFATVHLKQELEALLQRRVDLMRLRKAILRDGVSA
jgi:predicted nucleotidyltransferase